MKRLEALPLSKSIEIAYKSIKVRFFRSLITTISLILAVSFLAFTQTSDIVASSVLEANGQDAISKLVKLGYDVSTIDSEITPSAKQRWVVILSLLVCVVGIVNAQLMSVTERFREIGTMKCLGALDKVVVRLFIIEASLQGFVGAFSGALLGIAAAIFMGIIRFGLNSFPVTDWGAVSLALLIATVIGTLLSLLGALYPAVIAAKMQPVEAMRVEQ